MPENKPFDSWAIVEVMGHSRYAGRVTEQAIGGSSFVRVDVPQTPRYQAFTKLLGASSIFAITPCDEQIARAAAETSTSSPMMGITLPETMQRQIEAGKRLLAAQDPPTERPVDAVPDPDFDGDDEYCPECGCEPCDCQEDDFL